MTAYIWDLDGTLLDSYDMIVEAACGAAERAGIQDGHAAVLKIVKQSSVRSYLNEVSERTGITYDTLRSEYQRRADELDDRIPLMEGAWEVLERLRKAGAEHFVYTHRGGASSKRILKRLDIYDVFTETVTADNGFAPKPSGEGVSYLLDRYNLSKADSWYVGDRLLDMQCAGNAGIGAILYRPDETMIPLSGYEDRVIHTFAELA